MPEPTIVVPAPGGRVVAALAGAPVPVVTAPGHRRPAGGRLCCCVADPLADAPLEDVWPRWARAPDVALVVVAPADALVRAGARPERLGLLHVADVVLEIEPAGDDLTVLRDLLVDACRRAAAARADRPVPARTRIGVATPWPPDPAGPAHTMRRLVGAAPPGVALEVVTGAGAQAAEIEGWSALLCSLGDSPFHIPAWETLMSGRADVLLHDARIGNLYEALLGHRTITPERYRATVARERHRLPAAWRDHPPAPIPRADAERLGLTFLGEVLDRADRILVHSDAARVIVAGERPDRERDIRIVTHGGPAVTRTPEGRRDAGHVATFGYPRDPDRTIAALAHARRRRPGLRLTITGDAGPPAERRRLERLAASLGAGDAVVFDGWVDEEAWRQRLATATVALQLRAGDRGESSATIAHCLAAGLPVITTAVGAVTELPDDAVVRVPPQASAARIGDELAALVADPERRAALAAAGRRWQAARQPRDAARSLVEAVTA